MFLIIYINDVLIITNITKQNMYIHEIKLRQVILLK